MATANRGSGKAQRQRSGHQRQRGSATASARGPDPDLDILAQIERGEYVAALTELMRRHGDTVYRYCREQLHDRALADDVQQQIFIQTHEALSTFAGRSALRTWLFAIARHRVLDAVKARRRAAAHIDEDPDADVPDPTPTPGERIDDACLMRALLCCIRKLPDDVRDVVLLRYQNGFTFEELAEIFHDKPGTLQARISRALPVLRRCIESCTKGKL